jgi:hypothetical protein
MKEKVFSVPSDKNNRLAVYKKLADYFEKHKRYTEIEINSILKDHILTMDHAFFRRELIDYGIMKRSDDGLTY